MRGRRPTPTAIHLINGTYRRDRHAGRANAGGDVGEPPEWMSAGQREAWIYAVENAPTGVMAAIDRGLLEIWVVAADQQRIAAITQATLDANTSLPLLVDKKGRPAPSPYLKIVRQAGQRMLLAARELGFTPASRARR